ncbi:hypothetical protein CDAR_464381 [Caerostris darwini]|uniref:Uncharacterized protein n=1 Tax=Caerostris darwini TaxID=1538125 RepID=A0AAV4VTM4_9ARAC|nr:hypothetical protein CDAR_464381 [Caerostris darwini]
MIHKNENFPFPRHFETRIFPEQTLSPSAEVIAVSKGDPLRDGRYANRKSTRIPLERLNHPAMLSADKAPQRLGPPEISGKVVDQPHPSGGGDVTGPSSSRHYVRTWCIQNRKRNVSSASKRVGNEADPTLTQCSKRKQRRRAVGRFPQGMKKNRERGCSIDRPQPHLYSPFRCISEQ